MTSGVPQGSVLGHLLFLPYINDLPQNIQSQVRLFADDTAFYLTVNSHEAANTLQADLDTLQEWELRWDMEFNPGKCQVINITKSRVPFQSQYTLHGQTLEPVDSAKYLGVTISQDLNWNIHINNITDKANRTLGFIKRNVKTKNESVQELAYKTLVRPQVEYASTIWSPHAKQNTQNIKWPKDELPDGSITTTLHMTMSQQCLITLVGDPLKTDALIPACSCSTELFMVM